MKKKVTFSLVIFVIIFVLFETISVYAIPCNQSSDCGTEEFVGIPSCSGNDVFQNFLNFTCNNPFTNFSLCEPTYFFIFKKDCLSNQVCHEGDCFNVTCFNNSGCNDNNASTDDICVNQGQFNANCLHLPITCSSNQACGTDGFYLSPFCDNNNILRDYITYTCNNPGTGNSSCISNITVLQIQACSSNQQCSNAVCLNVTCISDSDPSCNDHNAYTEDHCINPNTTISSCNHIPIVCLNDSDPHCNDNNASTEDHCINPNTTSSYCSVCAITCFSDLNCGVNGFIGSQTCSNNNIFRNFITYTCNNPGTCNTFCSNSTALQLFQNCSANQLCSGGVCLEINCFNDLICNDNNAYTEDKCINPGTLQSYCNYTNITCLYDVDSKCNDNNISTEDHCINPNTTSSNCTHTPITCFFDIQCGTNGFIGSLFCQNNNIYQNYSTYTCNNAQTAQSYCSNSTQAQLKQTCGVNQTCSNGACYDVFCFNDTRCNDNNISTFDECRFPGTAQSYCNYTNIICNNSSDCGINNWVGNAFCNDGTEVLQDFITYTCNNPGTTQSSCSSVTAPLLKQTCNSSQLCSNAVCFNV